MQSRGKVIMLKGLRAPIVKLPRERNSCEKTHYTAPTFDHNYLKIYSSLLKNGNLKIRL